MGGLRSGPTLTLISTLALFFPARAESVECLAHRQITVSEIAVQAFDFSGYGPVWAFLDHKSPQPMQAKVKLVRSDPTRSVAVDAHTDTDGHMAIVGLAQGLYHLTIGDEPYQLISQPIRITRAGPRRTIVVGMLKGMNCSKLCYTGISGPMADIPPCLKR